MALRRVRALKPGFDGKQRRLPGEEFDFDIDKHGVGSWFEAVDGKTLVSKSQKAKNRLSVAEKKASDKLADEDVKAAKKVDTTAKRTASSLV